MTLAEQDHVFDVNGVRHGLRIEYHPEDADVPDPPTDPSATSSEPATDRRDTTRLAPVRAFDIALGLVAVVLLTLGTIGDIGWDAIGSVVALLGLIRGTIAALQRRQA